MLDATGCRLEDSLFYHVTIKVLRAFIDPDHHLILIDEKFAFPRLAESLENCYRRGNGRQGVQLEVSIRQLLISSLYNITPLTFWNFWSLSLTRNRDARNSCIP